MWSLFHSGGLNNTPSTFANQERKEMMNERQKQSNAAMNKEIARKFYERIANKQ